jgi:hypothetical protein
VVERYAHVDDAELAQRARMTHRHTEDGSKVKTDHTGANGDRMP